MQTRTDTQAQTQIHTWWHDERCQLFSAMRQCIFSSRSNICHLGEKYSLCFCSKRPCSVVCAKNCNPAFYIMWRGSHLGIKIIHYHDTEHQGVRTFSLWLRALMTFAAKVRPEEFSTHLCTWPNRPLEERENKKEYFYSHLKSFIQELYKEL